MMGVAPSGRDPRGVTMVDAEPTGREETPMVPHQSAAERARRGKEDRRLTPRSSHASFEPAADRPDPVELLERQATSRVPELVPIRYGRMLVSPFTFFRGAALIMASDLAATPRTGLTVQLCGDAHLSNFGVFASPERSMLFDVNDFDETLPGPWEWDLKRLAASVAIAGQDREFSAEEVRAATVMVGSSYRAEMVRLAGLSTLDVWYTHIDVASLLAQLEATAASSKSKADKRMAARTAAVVSKARTRDNLQALAKLTTVVDGRRQIVSDPPLIERIDEVFGPEEGATRFDALHGLVRSYRSTLQSDRRELLEEFELVDIARKVVGVGSVGTRAWVMLLVGPSDDPLFLQAKEAQSSVLEEFLEPSEYDHHGERVVAGQHLMQAASDIFLGWQRVEGVDGIERDYYIRQLRDWKGSFDIEGSIPEGFTKYAAICAQALARAHARSGDQIAIASYLGSSSTFDEALADFAETYARQNLADFEALKAAAAEGRVQVESGL
jgi:uncharacterized protein (DUF2252 family)